MSVAIVGLAAGPVACGGAGETSKREKSGATALAIISAQDKSFSPDSITVPAAAATIISFRNNDTVAHTFTVFDREDFTGEIVADSGPVLQGEVSEVTVLFGSPGRHAFQCQIHPQLMHGILVVE
jgi:plastocyanin